MIEDDVNVADHRGSARGGFGVECPNNAPTVTACRQCGVPDLVLIACSLAGDRISDLLGCVDGVRTAVIILMSGDPVLLCQAAAFFSCLCLHKPFGADELENRWDGAAGMLDCRGQRAACEADCRYLGVPLICRSGCPGRSADGHRLRRAPEPPTHADCGGSDVPLEPLIYATIEHLTAIRLYAAGACRALTNRTPEQIEFALGRIDEQACRAHDLLREVDQHGGADRNQEAL